MNENIIIKGARENNLKNIDLELPRNKFIVFTGLSGSGKSSLAFDTIFAEGQRKYIESLSSYARQFLGQMDKPAVDYIEGLSPAISIDQKTTSHNPRSTVGTVTEIYDYLRLLYARIGQPHCPKCGKVVEQQNIDSIVDSIASMPEGSKIRLLAPVVRGRKGEFQSLIDGFIKNGFSRLEIDGNEYSMDSETVNLEKNIKHDINVIVDRLIIKQNINKRLSDSVESCLKLAEGLVVVENGDKREVYSTKYACQDCGISIEELEPRMFSFNNPFGACEKCKGLGFKNVIDPEKIIKDRNLSINQGAFTISGWNLDTAKISGSLVDALSKKYKFSLDTPIKDLSKKVVDVLLYGDGAKYDIEYNSSTFSGSFSRTFEGIANNLIRRYSETTSDYVKLEIEKYMTVVPCDECGGSRLKAQSRAVTVGDINIVQMCNLSITDAYNFVDNLKLNVNESIIAEQVLKEVKARLSFLLNVGLNYLSLSRSSQSLSGGEAQRIRLATQIGSGLVGVLYILDEPSIGLHQRDNDRLIGTLIKLRDLGNTLIVVEHDEDTMEYADYIVDIGPGAGVNGGYVVAKGTPQEIKDNLESITGAYMSKRKIIQKPVEYRVGNGKSFKVINAHQNNLKNIDVEIPLGKFNAITGVSGSGKSSLVNEVIYPILQNKLNNAKQKNGECDDIIGVENLDKVICIDQSPIGRTPRSNPATYTGVFDEIRDLFSQTTEAKIRGYKKGRFSFNVSGGRCENCSGDGIIKIEMHFLSDVYVQCDVCKGKRYNRETLEVKYKGKNVYEVLEMTVEEACVFFENIPQIFRKIKTLAEVGLGYIKLGQPATTLSGGEAQRVKLATELSKRSTGNTIYILDEPTTGLHTADVEKLINILNKFVDSGNTVLVIEHNLDIIKVADYVIDLGPEGGDKGGTIVATGTPEEIMANENSFTGKYLKLKIDKEKGFYSKK